MSRKIESLCTQFSLHQTINQHTHFTEHSSSLIDILLVINKDHLILSGVGDPFLNQEIRYHCPIYSIFKFSKPKSKLSCGTFGATNKVTMTYYDKKSCLSTGVHYRIMMQMYMLKT